MLAPVVVTFIVISSPRSKHPVFVASSHPGPEIARDRRLVPHDPVPTHTLVLQTLSRNKARVPRASLWSVDR